MLSLLLPKSADRTYHGHRLALWLFALLVFMTAGMCLVSIFSGYSVAISADGIPLDTYTSAGAQAVVSLLALLGLARLVICLLCVLVLTRYRSMIPLMFALLLLEHLGRRLILHRLPIARVGTPPGSVVNLVLLALMLGGLTLSLWNQDQPRTQA